MTDFRYIGNNEQTLATWGRNTADAASVYLTAYCEICGTKNQTCTGAENHGIEEQQQQEELHPEQRAAAEAVADAFRTADYDDPRTGDPDYGVESGPAVSGWNELEPDDGDDGWPAGFIAFG